MAQQAWQREENQTGQRDARPVGPVPPGITPQENGARPVRLTSRGAVLLMVCVFTVGFMMAALLGATVLAGVAFVLGAATAARYTRPADLLTIAVSPPLAFFCVLLGVKTVSAPGNLVVSVIAGCALALASLAPWLFIGVAVNLIIAWARGLPLCVTELRRSLSPAAARPTPAAADGSQAHGSR